MIYESTPWYSYAQFSDIFHRISDLDDHENVLFQIELWKAHGKVPAAIHATYLLLNVILCDRKSQIDQSNIRDLYAMSIIRTVNLLLDQEQDSLYAKSMLLMGKEANLPETIIKCRHRCSHGDIPDIESLRLVSREAVNYIYKKYWVNQYNLINSKLNDDYQYSFLVFATFLLCRSGFNSETKNNLLDSYLLKRYSKNTKNSKQYFKLELNSDNVKILIENNDKLLNLVSNQRNLSIDRHLNSFSNKNISDINRQTVDLFNFTTKKLLNSCVHEDIFISVFVEYVFCNHKPEQSQLFFLFFFYTLSHLSFNFTLKLVAHMFNYILETNDMFTDLKTHYKDSITHRVKLYRELMTNFNNVDLNKMESDNKYNNLSKDNNSNNLININSINNEYSFNENHDNKQSRFYDYQAKVNDWLLALIHYGTSLKNKQISYYHLKYLKIIKVLSNVDYHRMINYELTSLSRILESVNLLSSLLLLKVPNPTSNLDSSDSFDWRSDKMSYLINISKCLKNSGKYKFQRVEDEEREKIVMESRENFKEISQELNKNLLPGTIWDNQQCKVVQTYPLDSTYQVSTHSRILSAFERIRNYDFMKYLEGNRKREKIQSQMCNINGFIDTGNSVQDRLQKKLFKIVSSATNDFK